jgi:signal transduction histidine kinase/ActR/RegA family two-component response regulator
MADSRFSKETAFVVEAEGITSQMAVPIRIGDQIEGLLYVDNRGPRPFTDVDEGALVRLAEHASIAIRNAQLFADRGRAEAALSERDVQLRHAQKMEAVGRLAGGIAHDFNNLLTIIRGRSELTLSRGRLDPVTRRTLTLIDQASQAAAALIRRLLAFSQRQVLQPTVLDLNEVVTSIERMLRALLREDVQLVLDLAQDLSPIVADASMIEQIIMNLAVNAHDAMPKGGRLIIRTMDVLLDDAFVRANPDARPGPHVCLEVQDTGIGMDVETLARIFEPFFTTKASGKGTGLGLATVYGIVKQHQGSIRVGSRLGHGATFTVYLPRAAGKAVIPPELPGHAPEIPRGQETVLLVEDDASVRQLAQELLESYGYRVLPASDGPRAFAIAEERAEPIHLLVTDVIMPEMSGPDLAQRLLTARPEMRVLYISGYADEALGPHGISRPGTALLDKPFSLEAFLRKVRQILDPAKSAPPIEPPPPPVS